MTLRKQPNPHYFRSMRNFIWSVVGVLVVAACLGVLAAELYFIGWAVISIFHLSLDVAIAVATNG